MRILSFSKFYESEDPARSYSFEELSPEAQEKALDTFRDINTDYDRWHEPILEGFIEDMMEEFGVDIGIGEIFYTGFYSQGDGASFRGGVDDEEKFFKNALGLKSSEYLDMGEEEKSDDEDLVNLMGDLRNIGFDNRERLKPEDFYIQFTKSSSRYEHSNTMDIQLEVDSFEIDDDDERDFQPFVDNIENKSLEWAREKADELYSSLYKYYEELQEDDEVKETIIANDYQFNEDGSQF
jgi:hypothetical protein